MNQQKKSAMLRLLNDLKEIQTNPIEGVSAVPLDDENMFEWHCNFKGPKGTSWEGSIFHLILFFPDEYPAKSPSAEFVPKNFQPLGGATKPGKKGTQVCLSIFSDFAQIHTEWANEKGTGWSPSYTTQVVLLNLVSFLNEMTEQSYNSYNEKVMAQNISVSKSFECPDCGHTSKKPFPPLPDLSKVKSKKENPLLDSLTCYVTKKSFSEEKDSIFGFGISKSGTNHNISFTSPCEAMTLTGFENLEKTGKVESVMREEIHYFLPLFINSAHGSQIKKTFEDSCSKMTKKPFTPLSVLDVIPKLLNSTVVTFMNGTTHTSERALQGYFQFHRLFLWAVDQYPSLQNEIDSRIMKFINSPEYRLKKNTPNIGEWLALLTVSNPTWQQAARAYLTENFERNVMWYLKENPSLASKDMSIDERLSETFRLTKVSRDLLSFQTLFLDIARPSKMTRDEVKKRYDDNYGMPTSQMETQIKEAVKLIKEVKDYPAWFKIINVTLPTKPQLSDILWKSVETASTKDGYFDKRRGSEGSRGGNRGRGKRY